MAKLLAAVVAVVLTIHGVSTARAHTGGPHAVQDLWNSCSGVHGCTWDAGTFNYRFDDAMVDLESWRARINEGFNEIDALTTWDIHFDAAGYSSANYDGTESCADIDPAAPNYIGLRNFGDPGFIAKTLTCDENGNDGVTDFFMLLFDTNNTYGWDADSSSTDPDEYEIEAVTAHEAMHAHSMGKHWSNGTSICGSPTYALMCSVFPVIGDANLVDISNSDEHDDVAEFLEVYPT